MKTKTNARVLAWLVALCMVFAIIPVMPAEYASAAEGNVLKYDFSKMLSSGNLLLTPGTESNYGDPDLYGTYNYDFPKATGSAEWAIHSIARSKTNNNGAYVNVFPTYIRLYTGAGYYIALNLKIKVNQAGEYVPYINNKQWNPGKTTFKVSLYKMAADGSFGDLVFTNAAVQANDSGMGIKLSEAVSLEANTEYGLQFHSTGQKPASGEQNPLVDIYSFTLAEEVAEITSSEVIPTTMAIGASKTTKFGVSTDANAEIREVSSNSSDVSVTPNDDGSYTINAVRAGFATITVASDYATKQYNIAVRNAPTGYTYYFSGILNESVNMYTENAGTNNPDNVPEITFDMTSASNSAPWKLWGGRRSSNTPGKYVVINPADIAVYNDGGNSAVYIGTKMAAEDIGWYTISTDATFESQNKSNLGKLTIFCGNPLAAILTRQTSIQDVYNVDKPVYLPEQEYRFYFESNSSCNMTLKSMTLTPVSESEIALEAQSTVPLSYNVGDAAASVAFKVGAMTPTSVSVTANTNEAAVATAVSGDTVTFTPGTAGTASVTVSATYTYGTLSKTVSKTYDITVTKPATEYEDATGVFGSKYAYVTRNADGTYDVSFIGGINKLDGFKKVGFEVSIGSSTYYLAGENVYSSIVVNGETKEASHYGADYLFVSTVEDLESNKTIKIKPYVVDENNNRVYHEGVELELKI